jgi:hypothetical protein
VGQTVADSVQLVVLIVAHNILLQIKIPCPVWDEGLIFHVVPPNFSNGLRCPYEMTVNGVSRSFILAQSVQTLTLEGFSALLNGAGFQPVARILWYICSRLLVSVNVLVIDGILTQWPDEVKEKIKRFFYVNFHIGSVPAKRVILPHFHRRSSASTFIITTPLSILG